MGKNVAIIGGGISGLACAQRLSESNDIIDSITVFDTGNRSCGGRASSRVYPKAGFEFDHAAQYFSVKDENTPFSRYCRAAIDRNELYVIDNDRYGIISPGNNAHKNLMTTVWLDTLPSTGFARSSSCLPLRSTSSRAPV